MSPFEFVQRLDERVKHFIPHGKCTQQTSYDCQDIYWSKSLEDVGRVCFCVKTLNLVQLSLS